MRARCAEPGEGCRRSSLPLDVRSAECPHHPVVVLDARGLQVLLVLGPRELGQLPPRNLAVQLLGFLAAASSVVRRAQLFVVGGVVLALGECNDTDVVNDNVLVNDTHHEHHEATNVDTTQGSAPEPSLQPVLPPPVQSEALQQEDVGGNLLPQKRTAAVLVSTFPLHYDFHDNGEVTLRECSETKDNLVAPGGGCRGGSAVQSGVPGAGGLKGVSGKALNPGDWYWTLSFRSSTFLAEISRRGFGVLDLPRLLLGVGGTGDPGKLKTMDLLSC